MAPQLPDIEEETPKPKSEQEKVAARIEEKAKTFTVNAGPKYNSLPPANGRQLLEELEIFIDGLYCKHSPARSTQIRNIWQLKLNKSNGFAYIGYLGKTLIIDLQKLDDIDGRCHCLWNHQLIDIFQSEGESWIKLAVFLEEDLEKIEEKFERLYRQHQGSLLNQEIGLLSSDVYFLLRSLERMIEQRDSSLFLLHETIDFLKSTKSQSKSSRVKKFREHLEEELRKVGFAEPKLIIE